MDSSTRLILLLGLQLAAGAAVIGCGDGAEDELEATGRGNDTTPQSDEGNGVLRLIPSPMYSAFVEGGVYVAQVPVRFDDTSRRGKGATFTASDPSIASVVGTVEGAMVTVKKEGVVTIKAALDGDTGTAKLIIKKYTEAQLRTGQARYSKRDLAIVPAMPGGAISLLELASGAATRDANGACDTCHSRQARVFKLETTPTQIAGYTDDELITIFTMGKKPEGFAQKLPIPPFAWGMSHSWTVTEEEKQGLIAFMRTRPPKANLTTGPGPTICSGARASTDGGRPPLCEADGKPITIPGPRGLDGGIGAGMTTTTLDAGKAATIADADAVTAGGASSH
jgi:hypothetical protein